jgi:hypothetical protein
MIEAEGLSHKEQKTDAIALKIKSQDSASESPLRGRKAAPTDNHRTPGTKHLKRNT